MTGLQFTKCFVKWLHLFVSFFLLFCKSKSLYVAGHVPNRGINCTFPGFVFETGLEYCLYVF